MGYVPFFAASAQYARSYPAAVHNPNAVHPKVPQMNKSDSLLHKKSSSSGAAVFPAAETDQNGKKV